MFTNIGPWLYIPQVFLNHQGRCSLAVDLRINYTPSVNYCYSNMASIPTYTTVSTPLLQRPSFWLTESPVHDPRTGLTWFTDIPDKAIYNFELSSSEPQKTLRRIDVPEYVGCIALIEGDERRLLLGAKQGVATIDIESGEMEYLNKMYDEAQAERMRVNDGGVDAHGRFWFGSMRR